MVGPLKNSRPVTEVGKLQFPIYTFIPSLYCCPHTSPGQTQTTSAFASVSMGRGIRRTPVGGLLWPSLRAVQVWGANTGVGKTVMSTILCVGAAHRRPREGVQFLKPVSTGTDSDSDTAHVRKAYARLHKAGLKPNWFDSQSIVRYDDPVSPHIAAAKSERVSQDNLIP